MLSRSDGSCCTCWKWQARWIARLGVEVWQVCNRCRDQAVKLKARVRHEPMHARPQAR